LGYQGQKQFGVSLLGSFVQTWSSDCLIKFGGQLFRSCEKGPVYATNYFDNTTYFNDTNFYAAGGIYDGYQTTGNVYNSSVCVKTNTLDYFCTIQNQQFYVADSVFADNWNYGLPAYGGTFGLGFNSPVWKILGDPNPKIFDVYFANYNKWSEWAFPAWDPITTQSVINLGFFDDGYQPSAAHTSIKPQSTGSYLLPLDMFMFGKTYSDNSASYVSILNNETDFGLYASTATLAPNVRGLGLPTNQFDAFASALSVITQGEATCLSFKGGYCALANTCDYYEPKGLWEYDFKIKFTTQSDNNYIRVPLASFAANHIQNNGLCVIFVEYLLDQADASQQIIIGGMFF